MTQQDQAQKCCNSSSGGGGSIGRSSKKPKQKKVPQRGLGVAQLEKIRIEEQQRKEAAVAAILPTPPSSSLSSSKTSYLPLPIANFEHSNQPSTSPISLHSGLPADFTSLPLSLQNIDASRASSTVSVTNSGNFESGWHSIPIHGHGNVPKLCDFEKEFLSSVTKTLPYEANPTWPLSNWTQRTQQYQQPSSSMVNVSSGNLSSPVYHYSIEPPSNQNRSSSCVPMRPEEKMMGMKRSYPFSLDVPPASSFNFKLPTFTAYMKANETTSCGSGTVLNFDCAHSTIREVTSCSTPNSERNSMKSNLENENLNGEFLTLALPTPPCKFKSTSTFQAFHNQEFPDFESPPSQGVVEDKIAHGEGYSQFNLQQQPFHSFFPPKAAQIAQTTTRSRVQNCNGGKGESVDLNLRL